jgi:hypothetical protein
LVDDDYKLCGYNGDKMGYDFKNPGSNLIKWGLDGV